MKFLLENKTDMMCKN